MRPIPASRLGDAHGLLRAINDRERLRVDEFVTEFSVDELFPPGLENALGRTRQFVSYARAAGLLNEDRGTVQLTDMGKRYVRAGDDERPFDVVPAQAEWLRRLLRERHMTDSIYHGAAVGLSLFASNPPDFRPSRMDVGRAISHLGRAGWDSDSTFESQGERYTTFLIDLELIQADRSLTDAGRELRDDLTLPIHASLKDLAAQLNPDGLEGAIRDGEAEAAAEAAAAAPEPGRSAGAGGGRARRGVRVRGRRPRRGRGARGDAARGRAGHRPGRRGDGGGRGARPGRRRAGRWAARGRGRGAPATAARRRTAAAAAAGRRPRPRWRRPPRPPRRSRSRRRSRPRPPPPPPPPVDDWHTTALPTVASPKPPEPEPEPEPAAPRAGRPRARRHPAPEARPITADAIRIAAEAAACGCRAGSTPSSPPRSRRPRRARRPARERQDDAGARDRAGGRPGRPGGRRRARQPRAAAGPRRTRPATSRAAPAPQRGRWLIADELDRAPLDDALGGLSSYLAGLPVGAARRRGDRAGALAGRGHGRADARRLARAGRALRARPHPVPGRHRHGGPDRRRGRR